VIAINGVTSEISLRGKLGTLMRNKAFFSVKKITFYLLFLIMDAIQAWKIHLKKKKTEINSNQTIQEPVNMLVCFCPVFSSLQVGYLYPN
jgi:hypothetical protein